MIPNSRSQEKKSPVKEEVRIAGVKTFHAKYSSEQPIRNNF
jgi:hypothetical protein